MRGCIGRAFAWQEVMLVISSIVQKFDLSLADHSYNLDLKQTLTLKPKDFHIKAKLRTDVPRYVSTSSPSVGLSTGKASTSPDAKMTGQPLYIVYGSNTGTSESLAQKIAGDASAHGESLMLCSPLVNLISNYL
jgi:cytochrome P450 / NADPH-cytochrome P450 reductase